MTDNGNATELNNVPLSLFDVKELYDQAYAEKAKGTNGEEAFKELLAEAVKMDMAYRRQLAQASSYKDKKKIKMFNAACDNVAKQMEA